MLAQAPGHGALRAARGHVRDAGAREHWQPWDDQALQVLADFSGRYDEHIRLEEELVYPAAQTVLDEPSLSAMGADMQQRRTLR